MFVSLFAFLALVLCAAAAITPASSRLLRRRLRRPRVFQAAVAIAAIALVPANAYLALVGRGPVIGDLDAFALAAALASLAALGGIAVLGMALRIPCIPAQVKRRVLAIGAHPDDLELGCGGTIAKLADAGHEVHALVMSDGASGGDAAARPSEAMRGGRFLGTAALQVLDFTDTRLAAHDVELVQAIEQKVSDFNPDVILTHSTNDQHQDHLAVHLATLRAARQHSTILCYESPSTMSGFAPSVFVDIEDYLEVKAWAVGAHRDQRDKPYMTAERVRGLAVYRGSQAKTRHAEGYEAVRMLASPAGVL